MAVLGGNDPKSQSRLPPFQNRANSSAIAPWESQPPSSNKAIAPWDSEPDPQAQMGGIRPFGQSYFNDNSAEHVGQPSPPVRPSTGSGMTGTTDSPDMEAFDARRPSVASATTVSSQGSKSSSTGARFQKSLKSFFGDDPQADSRKGSMTNLPDQERNGKEISQPKGGRNDSVKTQNTIQEAPRPQTPAPAPSRDVTPWSYQQFSVSVDIRTAFSTCFIFSFRGAGICKIPFCGAHRCRCDRSNVCENVFVYGCRGLLHNVPTVESVYLSLTAPIATSAHASAGRFSVSSH